MPRKTYKREAATVLMGLNLSVFLYALIEGPSDIGEWAFGMAKYLYPYSCGAVSAAFFAEWLSTQSPWSARRE